MIRTRDETEEIPVLKLALAVKTPITDATVISWKKNDWNWLAMYKKASYDSPEFYRQIYKNYLRWYRCEQ